MIAVDLFKDKTVGILGLARSGVSAVHALHAGGARIVAWDDKELARADAPQGTRVEPWEQWPWEDLAAIVLSPGISLTHPAPHPAVERAKDAGVEIIGDLDLFARAVRTQADENHAASISAITGTNGKSTITALVGHILQACGFDPQIGGNIGNPALELSPPNPKTFYVLEVSSYQIDLSPHLHPNISVLSNISPDHIDRHGSVENYARVKAALLERTVSGGRIVVGTDDSLSSALFTKLIANNNHDMIAVSVGRVLGRGAFVIDGKLYDASRHPAEEIGDLRAAQHLPGVHNWQNAALAYAAVRPLVRDSRQIMNAILRFPGLAHRMEEVRQIGNVRFVNDSKATNAEAASRALACFSDIYWIAGGKAKDGGIASLTPHFHRIRKAYLIGDAAPQFAETLNGKVDFEQCQTIGNALHAAAADAAKSSAPEPVVLLSPACASFDQFRDFEERGDVFRAAVNQMANQEPTSREVSA
jgi:UDP-N-acetylmuramoylalanine--D-glutamate ligase